MKRPTRRKKPQRRSAALLDQARKMRHCENAEFAYKMRDRLKAQGGE